MDEFDIKNYFMYREPIGKIENFYKLSDKMNAIDLLNNDCVFDEAVSIASSSIRETINKVKNGTASTKEQRNINKSIFQYYDRYNTRTTPFGIFSSIGAGYFSRDNDSINKKDKYKKNVDIDLLWAYKLIRKIEDIDISSLKLKLNNALQKVGNYWLLDTRVKFGLTNNDLEIRDNIRIKNTVLLEYIANHLKTSTSFNELVDIISKRFKKSKTEVRLYVNKLVEQEFLVTELKFSLINDSPLTDIIKILDKNKKYDEINKKLVYIRNLIRNYEEVDLGKGQKYLVKIENEMKKIVENKNYLRIDLYNQKVKKISKEMKILFNDTLKVLSAFSYSDVDKEKIQEYHEKFIAKYGYEQLVPLQLLINKTSGLGLPENFEYGITNKSTIRNQELDDFFTKKIEDSLRNGTNIEIVDDDLRKYSNRSSKQLSGELYTFYYPSKNIIELGSVGISQQIGNTFGRFHAKFNRKIINKNTEELKNALYKAYPDAMLVQVNEVPYYGANANVQVENDLNVPHLELHNYSDIDDITINDIYVGANNKELYFYSKTHKKRLIFIMNNMFNYTNGSNLLRFMIEVSSFKYKSITPIYAETFEKYNHTPAVVYKNAILKPETWNLKKINLNKLSDLKDWLIKYQVPRIVRMKFGDYIILLDLNRDWDLNILQREIKKRRIVQLLKVEATDELSELVIPFTRKNISSQLVEDIPKNNYYSLKTIKEKYFFVKLIIDGKQQDNFLKMKLPVFLNNMKLEKNQYWFFIRYQDDNKNSIRIRIGYDSNKQLSNIYMNFIKWANDARKQMIISNYEISEYIPETYRYGGQQYSDVIHKFFYYDSILSLVILQSNKKIVETAISIIRLFEDLEMPTDEQKKLVDNLYDNAVPNREYEKKYHSIINEIVNYFYFSRTDSVSDQFSKKNMSKITQKLKDVLHKKDLTANKSRILGSLVHMRCNRVCGINSDMEKQIMFLIYKVINATRYLNKNVRGGENELL